MATDSEAQFPVRDFAGVDLQANSEDIQKTTFLGCQNMWERELGSLETRFGSMMKQKDYPSNVTKLLDVHTVYTRNAKRRLLAVQCTPDVSYDTAVPANMSLSFIPTNPGLNLFGSWNKDYGDGRRISSPVTVYIREVGYGVDKVHEIITNTISGFAFPSEQVLVVTVATAFSSNVTGLEVYAKVNTQSAPAVSKFRTLWCGHIDLTQTPTGVFQVRHAPVSVNTAYGAGDITNGANELLNLSITQTASGGTFKKGDQYFIMVCPQVYTLTSSTTNGETIYKLPNGDPFRPDQIIPVTIEEEDAALTISTTTNSLSFLVFIGESFQTMVPTFLANDTEDPDGGGNPRVLITDPPTRRPGVSELNWTASGTAVYDFRLSDYSVFDTFMRISDDGSFEPVFCSRLALGPQSEDSSQASDLSGNWFAAAGRGSGILSVLRQFPYMGEGAVYNFVNMIGLSFFVNNHNLFEAENAEPVVAPDIDYNSLTKQNYFVTDGLAAAPAIMDFQNTVRADRSYIPPVEFITVFEDSIVVGGGVRVYDDEIADELDASNAFLWSVIDSGPNPYRFRSDKADTLAVRPLLNVQPVESNAEKLSGVGTYANTGVDSGVESRLFLTKKNSSWSINSLPDVSSGDTVMDQLSGSVGCVNGRTIINTPVGTLMTAVDNVYILRGTGEPIPVGDQIAEVLKRSNMAQAVATYHDEHYKLSFFDPTIGPTEDFNNTEWWLDINRMKATKGTPSWKGPMVGRNIDSQVIENRDVDGFVHNQARDRWCVDRRLGYLYLTDVEPSPSDGRMFDFNAPVVSIFETKDFVFTEQFADWNKLFTRMYWKLRINKPNFRFKESTYADGELREIQTRQCVGTAGEFNARPFVVFPFFPRLRIRGRTIRKIFETKDRVSIGAINLHFRNERRRI
jgi:hypothetical protein